jgi:septal ring factor EnvC (AmiA/AmiB activator)
VAFSIKKENKLKKRLKRLRREQAENERVLGTEAAIAENEKHIDDIGKEYSKLKRQRRIQRFNVNFFFISYINQILFFSRNCKKLNAIIWN